MSSLREKLEASVEGGFADGKLPNLHACLVRHRGEVICERYFEGQDWSWGTDLGHRKFTPESLHDVRSATKSIVGLLYGIALNQGLVPSPEESLYAHFLDRPGFDGIPDRPEILIRHALTMTLGLEWNESVPYNDPRNSEIQMEYSPNRYRYVLERAVQHQPGVEWTYSGGATALIGKIIEHGTNSDLFSFAKRVLFDPLDIGNVDWILGYHGEPAAASGLRLTARDLEKIGRLILQEGAWNGTRIVPKSWLDASFTGHVDIGENDVQFGFQWWLSGNLPIRHPWVSAIGNGGQRLFVVPTLDLTIVTFFGNYDRPDAWQHPISFYVDFVIPALFVP